VYVSNNKFIEPAIHQDCCVRLAYFTTGGVIVAVITGGII